MIQLITGYILLQTLIDPTESVRKISTDSVYGALFILALALLIPTILYIRKTLQRQINELKLKVKESEDKLTKSEDKLIRSDEKYEKSQNEFIIYLQNQNAQNISIIKESTNVIKVFSERIDSYRIISEKLLLKN